MSTNVLNPFNNASTATEHSTGGMVESKSQREIAEVQAMVVMAKQFPRNPIQAMDRILNACTRKTLAEGAVYSYPRGGNNIEGPSIRLAETIAQNWGNIDFGIREISQSNGESTVEAYAWDLETNTRQVKTFQVPHKRFASGRAKTLTDPRDIYELIANNGARRLRACILGIIPGDVVESAVQQCSATLAANVDLSQEGIKKMVEVFASYGVDAEAIQTRYQCRIEALRPTQYLELRKIYTSLKDGMSKPSDWFVVKETTPPPRNDLNDVLDGKDETQSDAKAETAPPEKPALDAETFEAVCGQISTGEVEIEQVKAQYALTTEQSAAIDKL